MKIAFIGLGNVGSAMAMNLFKAEHNLTVYNRSVQKAKPLLDQGARADRNSPLHTKNKTSCCMKYGLILAGESAEFLIRRVSRFRPLGRR